ncbi:protein of unknown function (plasmid) [Cupriavidus taiwanensis]|uniref:Uncharacterized protein n=1 Tax=Cupriavidus taiwanensis TaxID=164546 RepID=A0A375ISA0_9BURK|nr:protein of unknown function [Cupriavidus taiwanensis]
MFRQPQGLSKPGFTRVIDASTQQYPIPSYPGGCYPSGARSAYLWSAR